MIIAEHQPSEIINYWLRHPLLGPLGFSVRQDETTGEDETDTITPLDDGETVTVKEASKELLVCEVAVRKMIHEEKLEAARSQYPPWRWEIKKDSLATFKSTRRFHRGPRGGVRWVEGSSDRR